MSIEESFEKSFNECIMQFFKGYPEWNANKLEKFKNDMKELYNYNYLNFPDIDEYHDQSYDPDL